MFRHLLVPVDGSGLSQNAMHASIALAKKLGAKITAFVAEPPAPTPMPGHGAVGYLQRVQAHDRETEAHAEYVLRSFEREAEAAGVPFTGCTARSNLIVEAILGAAEEHHCDLIVMATHVHGWFGEVLAASNTKGVMARSKLPLLVLH